MNAIWSRACLVVIVINTIDTQRLRCNNLQKQCNDGTCISAELYCNGQKNCPDGSDETGENCSTKKCLLFSFRCTYGGCISIRDQCNGKIDCADESDENALLCGYPTKNRFAEDGKFKCDSNQTISTGGLCDGKRDCEDGSDETTETCTSVTCPYGSFRCAYGGCISNELKCNRERNCADGSDEYETLCEWDTAVAQSTLGTGGSACIIPTVNALIVKLDETGEKLNPGSPIKQYAAVKYSCLHNSVLIGTATNVCLKGKWILPEPTCKIYCDGSGLNHFSIEASCKYKGNTITCDQLLEVGTSAEIACRPGYKTIDRFVNNIIQCEESGLWDYIPFHCYETCGRLEEDVTGTKGNIVFAPWQAAIYSFRNKGFTQICGGVIITRNLVISAAHCFWDRAHHKVMEPTLIRVAVGKSGRDYDAIEHFPTQYFNVSEIHIPATYNDIRGNYASDISVLVLNGSIEFKNHIQPICIEWSTYSERSIPSDLPGRLVGWGYKRGTDVPSEQLKLVEMPSVSYSDCRPKLDPSGEMFLVSDKFCIQNSGDDSICAGDTGGGFVTPKIKNGIKTYFLLGIPSISLGGPRSCDLDSFVGLTNVQYYQDMISNLIEKYKL